MAKAGPPKDIDEYIARFSAGVRAILEEVQTTIRTAAPEAKETISYQMPAFKQHDILVYFAAWKKHIGLYPPVSGDKALENSVARYSGRRVWARTAATIESISDRARRTTYRRTEETHEPAYAPQK